EALERDALATTHPVVQRVETVEQASQAFDEITYQKGEAVIRMLEAYVSDDTCRDGASQVTLTQGELSRDQPEKKPLAWRVPVIVKSVGASDERRSVIEGGTASLAVPGCEAVVVNAGQSGYYRTLYAPAHFERLAG